MRLILSYLRDLFSVRSFKHESTNGNSASAPPSSDESKESGSDRYTLPDNGIVHTLGTYRKASSCLSQALDAARHLTQVLPVGCRCRSGCMGRGGNYDRRPPTPPNSNSNSIESRVEEPPAVCLAGLRADISAGHVLYSTYLVCYVPTCTAYLAQCTLPTWRMEDGGDALRPPAQLHDCTTARVIEQHYIGPKRIIPDCGLRAVGKDQRLHGHFRAPTTAAHRQYDNISYLPGHGDDHR